MPKRSQAGGFIQRRVARAGSEARRNLFARTLAGQLQPRQCLNFNGAVGAVVLACAGIYLGLAWARPAMVLPLEAGWATGGFGLILVLGWWLGRRRRALLSAVLALGGLAGLAALSGYAWFVWTACEAVRAAGPVGPQAFRLIHLPGLLGLGAAYTSRLVLEFGVFRGRPGVSLVWPARVALVVGLIADAGLIWAVLTAFYL